MIRTEDIIFEVYGTYCARIRAASRAGFVDGHRMLNGILEDISCDSVLRDCDYINLVQYCDRVHIKLMEDNYNGTWKQ